MTELSNRILDITKDREIAQAVLIAMRHSLPIADPSTMPISEYTGSLQQMNKTFYVIHDAIKDLRSEEDIAWEKKNLIQGYNPNV